MYPVYADFYNTSADFYVTEL